MREIRRDFCKRLSVVTSILLIVSLIIPGFAAAQQSEVPYQSLKNNSLDTTAKINDSVLEQFEKEEKVTFLVKFKGKANTKEAAEQAIQKAEQENLTQQKQIFTQRSAVVTELKSTAKESQQNVEVFLEEEKQTGNVEDVQSYFIVNAMAVTATKEIAEKIVAFSEVEKILKDETRQLIKPEKTEISEETGDTVEWNIEQIGAPDVWNMGVDGTGTVVATIDSGVQWDHPALKEKYRGYNSQTGEVNHDYSWFDATAGLEEPYDDQGHGTHVTGTIVGGESGELNQIGVAPGAKYIAVRAFTAEGGKDSDLLAAADWIMAPTDSEGNERIDLAPDIVNNSWSGGPGKDEWYREVVQAWRDAQIFPVFAAGNASLLNPGGPGSIASPANYPESFAVGATDSTNQIADFSFRGPSPYDEIKPDLVAPGVAVRSAVPGNGYAINNGTSMATPAVSGVAALLRSADPYIPVSHIEDRLMETATPLTDEEHQDSPNHAYGEGLVNAFEAVTSVIDGTATIEGTVTRIGEDEERITYKHDPSLEAYQDTDLEISIRVMDDVAVTNVEVEYQDTEGNWHSFNPATQVSGDHRDGVYTFTIPGEHIGEGKLKYYWWMNDYSNKSVLTSSQTVEVIPGESIGYSEDFEDSAKGWFSFGENDTWEKGKPKSGPENAVSGDHVYATNLAGEYKNDSDATLVMPPVVVPEDGAHLHFKQWHNLELFQTSGNPYDFGYIVISSDKEEWTKVAEMDGYTDGWEDVAIDLSEYSGERIYIGFNLYSNSYTTEEGWYIDDVSISDNLDNGITMSNRTADKGEIAVEEGQLPLDATVSILETGRTAQTDPLTGMYSFIHIPGTYTLVAESYGYQSKEQTITIAEDEEEVSAEFILDKLHQATVSGQVKDESGIPIEDATLYVVEDANISPIDTDKLGYFETDLFEGDYTLKIVALGYKSTEIDVDVVEEDVDLSIELEKLYTYPGDEIAYDDGNAENARVFYDAGSGWAVKMSLPDDKESAVVTDGVFKFWGEEFPNPGRKAFAVEVWDASGVNGLPGEKIAGPIEAEAVRDQHDWTEIDLKEHNIVVNDDFYMVYIQTQVNPYAPALAVDEDYPFAERSYQLVNGTWSPAPVEDGNYVIRAKVDYEVDVPTIAAPSEGTITAESNVTVEGFASPSTTMKVMNNGEEKGITETSSDGEFVMDVELQEGENELQAITVIDGEDAKASDPVSIELDTIAPELTIDSPEDGHETDRETITIEGTVLDENSTQVTVNDETASIEDETYSKRIILESGENIIDVVAVDEAGNSSEEKITVISKQQSDLEIEDIQPASDLYVYPGDEVEISFTSNLENGIANYALKLPTENGLSSTGNMEEVEPGVYKGTWKVPANMELDNVSIEVSITDEYGNTIAEEAKGKLFISSEQVERISGDLRYDTAIEISQKGWDSADTVVLARGDQFADALTGVPLAHKLDAPILLTPSKKINSATLTEIERLGTSEVIILGGTGAISEDVETELHAAGVDVRRIAGETRFETAAFIAEEVSPGGADQVVITNGMDFPDAVSVASHAAKIGMPILLTYSDRLPEATADALENISATETIVVGGYEVVEEEVFAELPDAQRLRGPDRYTTNLAVNQHFDVNNNHLYVATGQEFADALTGAVLAAKSDSAIVLVGNTVPSSTAEFLIENETSRLTIFGGEGAVSQELVEELENHLIQ
ncbi:hypothetical protein CIL05_16810 [Virgibacillus profundi]|uniref:Peptidase S8/S53 domain-containing protein n=1 Tax=Virgibacillus profundi TaxID=2024555 RepID=A0A2A2I9I1_9BACI|nr:cell wall-binding repeat-containing protein [Virgibacillus profundi]PAV28297.1 hypothetical protein CIL05_16810 [Virgibacillus profundi]PXY54914.1 peptidase S8 [Virgibacillus profundi]